ncbi:hypothetical protein PQU92_14145 [Asticcacaulis sp. BYS171W]|uniref:STAS/SEC14 domain-containing protein n=1 Tax=Asticcacaulis aquaticus TaxID=2984212 RepID=A0ABT5HWK8_9CAUL|nr:hypothetical protein [Asticcacaulis aquaticus]MDC7684424.1 hypothetical protein [Asticcacaulis aquaticus]
MIDRLDVAELSKYQVYVDHDHHVVEIRYPSLNPNINLPNVILETFQGLSEPWNYDLIADMSEFDGFVPWEQLESFADIWMEAVERKDDGRGVAIVSINPLIFERMDGYQELWPGREFKIVQTAAEARAWLLARNIPS